MPNHTPLDHSVADPVADRSSRSLPSIRRRRRMPDGAAIWTNAPIRSLVPAGAERLGALERLDRVPGTAVPAVPAVWLGAAGRCALLAAAVLPVLAAEAAAAGRAAAPGLTSVDGSLARFGFGRSVDPGSIASVSAAASIAIVIGVLRWAPSAEALAGASAAEGDTTQVSAGRPAPAALLGLFVAVAVQLFVLAGGDPAWSTLLVGPLATTAILAAHLATFGTRSSFLLRRLSVLSLLLWPPVARAIVSVVTTSVDPLSDLVYRRLAVFDVFGVTEQPWRVFSAMTDPAPVVAVAAVVVGAAVTRRRVTARTAVELAIAVTAAIVVHHAVLLASPIERYDRPWWVGAVSGPGFELALGTSAALAAAWIAHRSERRNGRTQNPGITAVAGRDPVLFAVAAGDEAGQAIRLAAMLVPVVLLALLVVRTLAS